MRRASIFSSDMTRIYYFNIIIINIKIITDLTFSRLFKIFTISFSHHKFFVKIFFITSLQYLLFFIILLIKFQTTSSPKCDLTGVVENRATQDTFHSLKVNFFCHFYVLLFFIFLTPKKLRIETLKSFLGRSIFQYCHFSIYTLFEPFFS